MDTENIIRALELMITPERKQRFQTILSNRTRHFTVVVEDIFQLHNASAVVRSCEVFGIQEAHFIENRNQSSINENIALGAEKWIDIRKHSNAAACLRELKSKNYQLIATSSHRQAISLDDFDISQPAALIFGTEGNGVSEDVIDMADACLTIPMVGFTESLNISVAAAIVLQNLSARLRRSSIDWSLTPVDAQATYLNWLKNSIKNSDAVIRDLQTR